MGCSKKNAVLFALSCCLVACSSGVPDQTKPSLPPGSQVQCLEVPVPAETLGANWQLFLNLVSESPTDPVRLIDDTSRAHVNQSSLEILRWAAGDFPVVQACNFDYVFDVADKGHRELDVRVLVFSDETSARHFFAGFGQRCQGVREELKGTEMPDPRGHFCLEQYKSKAFLQRGPVFVRIETLLAPEDMKNLAKLLDNRLAQNWRVDSQVDQAANRKVSEQG